MYQLECQEKYICQRNRALLKSQHGSFLPSSSQNQQKSLHEQGIRLFKWLMPPWLVLDTHFHDGSLTVKLTQSSVVVRPLCPIESARNRTNQNKPFELPFHI